MSSLFFDRLRERAVQIHITEHLQARLERGEKLRVKLGLDPTAPARRTGTGKSQVDAIHPSRVEVAAKLRDKALAKYLHPNCARKAKLFSD